MELEAAGIDDADILIAVTASDEVNLVACQLAHRRFNVPRRIARVRSAQWISNPDLLSLDGFAVDVAISPEGTVTDYLLKLIEIPEALQVLEFAQGRVSLLAVRAHSGMCSANLASLLAADVRDALQPAHRLAAGV